MISIFSEFHYISLEEPFHSCQIIIEGDFFARELDDRKRPGFAVSNDEESVFCFKKIFRTNLHVNFGA
jgi:hypothetical protein